MKKKLVVHLSGGLGNQMFQYAIGRAIAERSHVELVLDTWTGFVRDKVYRRRFELNQMPIRSRIATRIESFPFWIDRVEKKFALRKSSLIANRWFGDYLSEPGVRLYVPEIARYVANRSTYIHGAWQTEKYFEEVTPTIREELNPLQPDDSQWLDLAEKVESRNSVAVGVRLYEEMPGNSKEGVGGLTSIDSLNSAAVEIAKQHENLHFYIFCTHKAAVLSNLRMPGPMTFVTHEDGFKGTQETLWLLSQFRHHIFTNSTFYWWGAWLSEGHKSDQKQSIWAARNFINASTVPDRWNKF